MNRGRSLGLCALLVACGKLAQVPDASAPDAGGTDATLDASAGDADASFDASCDDCHWNECDGGAGLGLWCSKDSDCCSGNCFHGSCQRPACVSDQGACASGIDCCSGSCTNGTCAPLNANCKVEGNTCTSDSDCCSSACVANVCVQPSYCGQYGDSCIVDSDCCGAFCTKQAGAIFGQCDPPLLQTGACSETDGVVCGFSNDGGPPPCGANCCSRNCVRWGPFLAWICLPPSGCHPVGDICQTDSDCCGGEGPTPKEVCNKATPDAGVGVCSNPSGCKPNGDICRINPLQCNATDMCCSGAVSTAHTCALDSNGTPRCSFPRDGGSCTPANGSCATSADCCNLAPCVPAGDAGFACYPGNCVPDTAPCSNDSDCCVGTRCDLNQHTCTTLAAPACALYGQLCSSTSDCCDGLPCTGGRCVYPPH